MTKVRFTFFDIEGNPLQNMEFTLLLNRASFNEEDTGVILPESLVVTTDALGQAIVDLWPLKAAYKIRIAEEYEEVCGKLNWSFYVPQSDDIVDAQHLFLVPPPRNIPWDEEAIGKINQAVIDTHNDAVSADASADRAEVAATAAEAAIDTVAESARQAKLSEEAAALSATTAGGASTAAIQARDEAEGFRDQSRTSELAAAGSATTATEQAGLASQEKVKAQEYAEQAEVSKNDAEIARQGSVSASEASAASADESAASATQTGLDKQATAADRVAVTGLKTEVTGLKDETKVYRDEALAAVGTITGAFVDGGLVDLSGGAYPTKPDVSTIWKVQVGGTVTTVKEGTIVYAAGDQLVYTKMQDTWYKNVSQSAVTKVNGKQGDVVLNKSDIGLPLVDNTPDVDKPISTAQQAAFDIRVPTSSRTDTAAGRLVKVGDYGENGGAAILKSASDDANAITIPGTYVFNGGGLNLPENTVYIKHLNHSVAGYSKQFAYGLQTNKVFVRTLANSVWTDWGPAVEIVDSLTSADPAKALSARQGKILLELLQANNSTLIRYTFNVAAGQTTITGNSLEGVPLSYVPGVPFMVEKDGFPIWLGNDYTASNGSSITLTESSTVASQFAITVFGAFSVADHYTKAQADVLLANVAAQAAEALLTVKWVPSRDMVALGTVPLDGGTYSRTTYPDAWALIRDGKVPKTTEALWASDLTLRASFTEGDGSTTFRVPDYNGKSSASYQALFIRGDGNVAAAAGVIQRDAFQGHQHNINIKAGTGAASSYGTATYGSGQAASYGTEGSATTGREAAETRPINVAGVWTIRLFGSTSNVGNIDVAQLAAQVNTLDNAAYKKTNIVGSVSQTGGVPTGAIIETGSNANGRYTKYADGTMICYFNQAQSMAATTAAGSMFYAASTWTFPAAFSSPPTYSNVASRAGGVCFSSGYVANPTNTSAGFTVFDFISATNTYNIQHFAIGRWY